MEFIQRVAVPSCSILKCCKYVQEDLQMAAKQDLEEATKEGNLDSIALWCGSGVGLIHSIESAENIFNQLWTVAQRKIATVSQQYPPARHA